jgi:hypothetical protein
MGMFWRFLHGLTLAVFATSAVAGEAISLATLPPVVVNTYPRSGETNVDPSIGEIRVTFSKDMMTDNMWSWAIHDPTVTPKFVGKVKYLADRRTNVAAVKLQANRTYAIWINSPNYQHNAFRDSNNNPAVPYLLMFRTGN